MDKKYVVVYLNDMADDRPWAVALNESHNSQFLIYGRTETKEEAEALAEKANAEGEN